MPYEIIAAVAVHFGTVEDVGLFRLMLASWSKQIHPCPLFAGLSSDAAIVGIVEKEVARIRDEYGGKGLTVTLRAEKTSQFQHYRLLADEMKGSPDAWVMFSDGDDLWSPHRVGAHILGLVNVKKIIRKDRLVAEQVAMCMVKHVGHPIDYADPSPKPLPKGRIPKAAADVDALIQSGLLLVKSDPSFRPEYWSYCVPVSMLHAFMKAAPSEVLGHRFADQYFVSWVEARAKRLIMVESESWGYYYRERMGTVVTQISGDDRWFGAGDPLNKVAEDVVLGFSRGGGPVGVRQWVRTTLRFQGIEDEQDMKATLVRTETVMQHLLQTNVEFRALNWMFT